MAISVTCLQELQVFHRRSFYLAGLACLEANSHKGSDGFRPQQSGRDSMLRLAALSASLQDIVGRRWRGQTNDIFGLVILRPLLQSGSSMLTTRQSMIQLEPCTFGRLSWGQGADL